MHAAGFALRLTKPVDAVEVLKAVAMTISGRASEFAAERERGLAPVPRP